MRRGGWLLFGLSFAPALLAQNANLSGRVYDRSRLPIAGAGVNVVSSDTGVTRSTQTDSLGFYNVSDLAPGRYDVAIAAQGFTSQQRQLVLDVAARSQSDF